MASFRSRFEYRPGMHRPRTIRNGTIFLAAVAAIVGFMFLGGTVPFLPKGGTTVKAEFETAANVTTKTPVRVRGIDIGQVEKVERRPGGDGVVVTMRIDDDKGVDLRQDARADIYWRTLLGFAFYIQLEPGAAEAKLAEGDTIPLERTTAQVELDQVLASLDAPSRAGIQTTLEEFETGFDEESKAGDVIDEAGPAMRRVAPGIDALRGSQTGDLTELAREGSRLMGALARNEQQLGEVVTNARTALAVTAAERAALGTIFREAPATLDDTRTTMARVRQTLDVLDPVAEKLRPGARVLDDASRDLRPALRELDPLLDRARPLLADLRPAVRRLSAASEEGNALISRLDPTVERMNQRILPGLNKVNPETNLKMFQAIGPTVSTVSSSASQFDKNGHTQRFTAVTPNESAFTGLGCSTDLINGALNENPGLDCSDLEYALATLFGLNPPNSAETGGPSDLQVSERPQRPEGSSGSQGDAAPASDEAAAGGRSAPEKAAPDAPGEADDVIRKLADVVGGVL